MSRTVESDHNTPHIAKPPAPVVRPLPIGFGRGRRTNQVLILYCTSYTGQVIPDSIPQLVPGGTYHDFGISALNGFASVAEDTGFDFIWHAGWQGGSDTEITPEFGKCDGVIFLTPRTPRQTLAVEAMAEAGIPVVLAYARHPDLRYPSVACDNAEGVTQLVHHLHRLGHTRIGCLNDGILGATFAGGERGQAYQATMSEVGLVVEPEWVVNCKAAPAEITAAVAGLLSRPGCPKAWVCFSDDAARILVDRATSLGLQVPRDLAVVGFDDDEIALQGVPHLTTVRHPTTEIARVAFHLMACCIEGAQPTTGKWQVRLPATLVIRESCGAAPPLDLPSGAEDGDPHTLRQELEWRMRQLAAMNQEMKETLHATSHDLRSPLITIQGYSNVLLRKCGETLDDRGRDYLQRIGHNVESMAKLIDSLLALSRVHNQPLDIRSLAVRPVVERAVADLQAAIAEKHARVIIRRRLPTVFADETSLYRVFLNLLSNALKYLGDQPAPLISVYCRVGPEDYEFTVEDNGIGISLKHQEEIFQPFRRVGALNVEGVGIGLAIVKRIILRHGGRVWVDSQEDSGSAFRFTLPSGGARPIRGAAAPDPSTDRGVSPRPAMWTETVSPAR